MIYELPTINAPLSQGDIIDGCPLFRQLATTEVVDLDEMPARWSSRVIVLTQACDLAQAKTSKVLVAVVHDAADLAGIIHQPGAPIITLICDAKQRILRWRFLEWRHKYPRRFRFACSPAPSSSIEGESARVWQ